MSREFQEHLFESFTREETSTVSGIQGTGLGMAINVSHMVQEIAMELLSNAGFSVSLADDGDVAVETLRTAAPDQFDLVLMAKLATTSSTGGLLLALQRAIVTIRPKGRYRKHFCWPAIKRYYSNLLVSILLLALLYTFELLHLLYCQSFQHNIL